MNAKDRRKERRAQARLAAGHSPAPQAAAQPSGPGNPSQAKEIVPLGASSDKTTRIRTAAVSVVMPYAIYNGRLRHPDPVVQQFGGFRGPAIYRTMLQENLSLSGACSQWEDRVNKAEQRIRPGVKDDAMSEQMARDAISCFRQLLNPNVINLNILRSRWYGFMPIGVAGWRKDERSGILAPFDLYNVDPWHFKFGPNFEPFLLTQTDLTQGTPVSEDDFFFARWGSLFTAYGESDLRDIYLECWFRQNYRELMAAAIEASRYTPVYMVPDTMQEPEFDQFEARVKKQTPHYIIFKFAGINKPEILNPNQAVAANGNAGGSEDKALRYIDGLIDRKIFGTMQTQDKTGGSRALEDSRMTVAQDKTPPVLQFCNNVWGSGYLDRISMANWPQKDRNLWPRMESINAPQPLLPATMVAVQNILQQLRMKEITAHSATRLLVRSGSFDVDEAAEIVASTLDERDGGKLSTSPAGQIAPLPNNETHIHEAGASA